MSLDERLATGRGLEPVPEEEVIRYWLGEEVDEEDEESDDESDDNDDGLLDPEAIATEPALRQELFEREPIAERVFGAEPADWYRTELSADELRDLRVVVGPPDQDWRALTDDNRVESIAELVHETDDVTELDHETPKDLQEVVTIAEKLADEDGERRPVGPLLVRKEGDQPAYIADGNHRAVAHVLHLFRGGKFEGQDVYLGVEE